MGKTRSRGRRRHLSRTAATPRGPEGRSLAAARGGSLDGAPSSPLMNPRELAAFLKVSASTVRRLVRSRKIPVVRVGGQLRFDQMEIRRALKDS